LILLGFRRLWTSRT